MIGAFLCKDMEAIFNREGSSRFRSVENSARRKDMTLTEHSRCKTRRLPRRDRLEVLIGAVKVNIGVRVNDRCRICFVWRRGGVYDVEVVDYH